MDDWNWLKEGRDPVIFDLLNHEKKQAESFVSSGPLLELVYDEILQASERNRFLSPIRKGQWQYDSKVERGNQYRTHYRREVFQSGERGEATLFFDENRLANESGSSYFSCEQVEVSHDHRMMACLLDFTGDEIYELRVYDFQNSEPLVVIQNVSASGVVWSANSQTLFYLRPDSSSRAYQVWRHALHQPPAKDVCVYEETDAQFHLQLSQTKDGVYLVIESASHTTNEVWLLDAHNPEKDFHLVEQRTEGVFYWIEHHFGWLFILSNEIDSDQVALYETSAQNPCRVHWRKILSIPSDVHVEAVDVFSEFIAFQERKNGHSEIRCIALPENNGKFRDPLPSLDSFPNYVLQKTEPLSDMCLLEHQEFHTNILRYESNSLTTPRSIYEFDMRKRLNLLVARDTSLTNATWDQYESHRFLATSEDGTQVPLTIVAKRGVKPEGMAPAVLYGYGAYGYSVPLLFMPSRLSLLDRGFVVAFAHVRGGGERGEDWHDQGKGLNKPNSIKDFIACAHFLIETGWCHPKRLVARGRSAGGTLVAATVNKMPSLFCGIVAEMPFVDCLTTLSDPEHPYTNLEWEEWGNPLEDKAIYDCIRSYSPYDNVKNQEYPAVYTTAALHDTRVGFWEPLKWVLKVRECSTGKNPVLLQVLDSGHHGNRGFLDDCKDEAKVLTFIIKVTTE